MAREYGKVWFSIFTDEHFTTQPLFDKLLYIALIGQPSLNYAGVQPINMRRLRKAMRDGDRLPDEQDLKVALVRLERRGYVYTDDDTGELLVRSFIRNDEVHRQPNILISALRLATQIESPKLASVLLGELSVLDIPGSKNPVTQKKMDDGRAEAVRRLGSLSDGVSEPFPEPFDEDFPEGIPEGFHEKSSPPGKMEPFGEAFQEGFGDGSVVVEVEVVKSPTAFTQALEKKDLSESSMSDAPRNSYPAEFERFWSAYPKREQKRDALKAWQGALKRASNEELIDGATRYCRDPNRETQYTKLPAGWLRGDMWLDGPITGRNGNQVRDGKSGLLVER
ncbi:hypothetical protein LQL77_06940 [Rhodococcus cerastii]|nr:hypothetical protein [Rhodococcus cerastii]